MSIDTLARQAGQAVMAGTTDLDVDDALSATMDRASRNRRIKPVLLVAAAVVVLIVGWSLGGDLLRSAEPAPPADDPAPVSVGQRLGTPMSAIAPEGWDVTSNRGYVEMRPADGAPGVRLFMLVPRTVYDPPSYDETPLKDDPIIWMTTHSDLTTDAQFAVDGPGFAWMGTKVDVSLKPNADDGELHLMPLSKASGSPPLAITADDAMFRWIVIYFTDSDPLAIAAISPTPDDPDLMSAINELLASIQVQAK
jgi:hypothetical protein